MKTQYCLATCLFIYTQMLYAADFHKFQNDAKALSGLGDGTSKAIQQPEKFTPRYIEKPEFTERYYGGGVQLPTQLGEDKIRRCKSEEALKDLYLRQECEGINLVVKEQTQRPDVSLSAHEKLVQGMPKIAGNPKETLEQYQWKYPINSDGSIGSIPSTACPTSNTHTTAREREHICSIYENMDGQSCKAKLEVNVDPEFNYACEESQHHIENVRCRKNLIVTCEKPISSCKSHKDMDFDVTGDGLKKMTDIIHGSDAIVWTSRSWFDFQAAKLHTHNNNVYLDFEGAEGIFNYCWHNCRPDANLADYKFNLFIDDVQKISKFSLVLIETNTYAKISINGKQIAELDAFRQKNSSKKIIHAYPPVDSFSVGILLSYYYRDSRFINKQTNIDARSLLKTGINHISISAEALDYWEGFGGGAVRFAISKNCEGTPKCQERWDNQCLTYESRS